MSDQDVTDVPEAFAPKTPAQKLAELQKRKAERDAANEAAAVSARIERLELEEKFAEKLGGDVDKAFCIVDVSDLGEGFVVLKLGSDVEFSAFKASKMNVVDIDTFVAPNIVHPSLDAYRTLAKRRGAFPDRCVMALSGLYGYRAKEDAGK